MYIIDYDDDWYNDNFHGSKDLEPQIDKLLSYLSYICYLRKKKILTNHEFQVFTYQLNRTCNSFSIEEYLWNLNHP